MGASGSFQVGASLVLLIVGVFAKAQSGESRARPPDTKTDLLIIQRADEILGLESQWNRADTRRCPKKAKTFSLYCALEKATLDVTGDFKHRGAVMQEARFVIDDVAGNRNYQHRLMNYNNDPSTTFADIKKVIQMTQGRIEAKSKKGH
jgi:hypothetical protein